MSEKQRKISLGFQEPSELRENIIYVVLKLEKGRWIDGNTYTQREGITAQAISNDEFTYHDSAIAGNRLTLNRKKASSETGDRDHSWYRGHREFLDDLVQSNGGVLGYSRLIEEGAEAHSRVVKAIQDLDQKTESHESLFR